MDASYPPLNPVKWLGKVLATWPRSGSKYVRLFYIFNDCLLFSTSFVVYWLYRPHYERREENTPLLFVSRYIHLGAFILHQLTIVLTGLSGRQHMNDVFKKMTFIDENLSDIIGSEQDLTESYEFQYKIMVALITLQLANFYLFLMHTRYLHVGLALIITFLRTLYNPVLLAATAHVIRSRYRSINTQLRLLQELPSTTAVLSRLKKLTRVHSKLCVVVREVNSVFALQLLTFPLQTVLGSAVMSLHFLQRIKSQTELDSSDLMRIIFLIKFSLMLIVMTEQCCRAAFEGNQSVILAHRLHQRHTNVTILNEIEKFSLSMIKNYIKFSAGGFLDIDRDLLMKIFVSITTYLIISLQIEDVGKVETVTTPHTTVNNSTPSLL